jgi:hypothetical protein
VTRKQLVKLLVISEQRPERSPIVALADPVVEIKTNIPIKRRVRRIVRQAMHKMLDTFLDVRVSLLDVVRRDGKVVRRVPAKELPCSNVVRFRLHHSLVKAVVLLAFCQELLADALLQFLTVLVPASLLVLLARLGHVFRTLGLQWLLVGNTP